MFPVLSLVSILPLLVLARAPQVLTAPGAVTECSAAKPPPALSGNLYSPETQFRWESDAGPADRETVCFDRRVRNLHKTDRLIFRWPPADMQSLEGIPPGGEYHYNAVLPADIEKRSGPLYYGGKDNSTPTAVYREKEGGPTARPGRSAASYSLAMRDSFGRLVTIVFSISTSFSASGEFTYTITNRGAGTVFLAWTSQMEEFDAALLQYKKARPEFSFDVDAGLKIPPGKEAAFILPMPARTVRTAMVKRTDILIYSADRKRLALVPYPGLFPPPR